MCTANTGISTDLTFFAVCVPLVNLGSRQRHDNHAQPLAIAT